jgi:hypothetical protein
MSVAESLYEPIKAFLPAGTVEGYLSQFCVQNRDEKFYVRDTTTGYWHLYSASAARKMLYQQHNGLQQSLAISRDGVQTYLTRDAYVVNGTVFIPNGPPGAVFDGRRCLNTYNDRASLRANPDILLHDTETRKQLLMFCRLIRESLCAKAGEKSYGEMMAILAGDDPAELEFRFVMHWLAAVHKSCGVNLQTNLWFLGELGGIGKGTPGAGAQNDASRNGRGSGANGDRGGMDGSLRRTPDYGGRRIPGQQTFLVGTLHQAGDHQPDHHAAQAERGNDRRAQYDELAVLFKQRESDPDGAV